MTPEEYMKWRKGVEQHNVEVQSGERDGRSFGDYFMGGNPYRPGPQDIRSQDYGANERGYFRQLGHEQNEYTRYLRDAVAGKAGPSVAEQQMRAGQAAAVMGARSQAASARGGNVALANRSAAGAQAQAMQAGNRDAGMLRAQEQLSREQLLAQQYQQQRQAELQSRGLGIDEAKANMQAETARQGYVTQISEGESERGQKGTGAIFGAIGGALGIGSDMRVKEDIQPAFGQQLQGLKLAEAPTQQQSTASLDQELAMQRALRRQEDERRMAEAPRAREGGGGGGGAGGIFSSIGNILSDKRAKILEKEVDRLQRIVDDPAEETRQLQREGAYQSRALSPEQGKRPDLQEVYPAYDPRKPLTLVLPDVGEGGYPTERHIPAAQAPSAGPPKRLIVSDRESKQEIASLRAELEQVGRDQPAAIRGSVGRMPDVEESRDNLGPVKPYTYRYKDDYAAASGNDTAPRLGVMAQDLQKSPAYQAAVIKTPMGLALDKDRLLSANTAELGGLDKRMRELEEGKQRALRGIERAR